VFITKHSLFLSHFNEILIFKRNFWKIHKRS